MSKTPLPEDYNNHGTLAKNICLVEYPKRIKLSDIKNDKIKNFLELLARIIDDDGPTYPADSVMVFMADQMPNPPDESGLMESLVSGILLAGFTNTVFRVNQTLKSMTMMCEPAHDCFSVYLLKQPIDVDVRSLTTKVMETICGPNRDSYEEEQKTQRWMNLVKALLERTPVLEALAKIDVLVQ